MCWTYFAETSLLAPKIGLATFCYQNRFSEQISRRRGLSARKYLFLSTYGSLGLLLLFIRQNRHSGADFSYIPVVEGRGSLLGDLNGKLVVQWFRVQSLEEDGGYLTGQGLPFVFSFRVGF